MTAGAGLVVLDPTGRPFLVLGNPPAAAPRPGPSVVPGRAMSSREGWDVVVIGGGPAGSVAAGTLAGRGRRVLLLEASAYPQARAGESLSPTCLDIIDRLGAGAAVRKLGSVPKTGATFLWGEHDRPWSVRYQPPGAPAAALHVRRAEFDEALRQAATALGAEVRRGSAVREVLFEDGRACGVQVGDDAIRARWVIDASGPAAVLGRQLGLVAPRPGRQGAAVWSYWTGARRLPEAAAYDSLYVGGPDRCWWYLPVGDDPDLTAVGMWDRHGPPSAGWSVLDRWYQEQICGAPLLAELLGDAHRGWPVQSMPADPYTTTALAGPGWLIAGDAGAYVDPILTPGVQLACEQGVSAARVADSLLSDGTREIAALTFYDAVCRRPLDTFAELCAHLYAGTGEHSGDQPDVLVDVGSAEAGSGRTTFLATISGLSPERVPVALGVHLGRRGAAAERGGAPPQFGETEGFAFLSRVIHERRLDGAADPGFEIGEQAFFDPDPDGGLIFAPAVSNRFGDRFALTPELEAALTGPTGDWCDLLAANGLAPAREADETCVG